MFGMNDLWPIKCANCGEEFTEEVGRIKIVGGVRCPQCECRIDAPSEDFDYMVADANAGRSDPWQGMLRIRKPDKR